MVDYPGLLLSLSLADVDRDIFILGLASFKSMPEDEQTSYFQLSGR